MSLSGIDLRCADRINDHPAFIVCDCTGCKTYVHFVAIAMKTRDFAVAKQRITAAFRRVKQRFPETWDYQNVADALVRAGFEIYWIPVWEEGVDG